jgi:hypothetical protein
MPTERPEQYRDPNYMHVAKTIPEREAPHPEDEPDHRLSEMASIIKALLRRLESHSVNIPYAELLSVAGRLHVAEHEGGEGVVVWLE